MLETELSSHYASGENWSTFAETLSVQQIEHAVLSLKRLLPEDEIAEKSVLDIGCGSGLSSLAAIRLGASDLFAVDIDPISTQTARAVLKQHAPNAKWAVEERSALELDGTKLGLFDIVYSWGVLHHTGAMWSAVDAALSHVAPSGLFAIALYRKTALCGVWRRIKRLYAHGGGAVRWPIRTAYRIAFALGLLVTGRSPKAYARDYTSNRGMTWETDIEDWLGGYPYESASPPEVEIYMNARGFTLIRSFTETPRLGGLLGSGCDEYVFQRGS